MRALRWLTGLLCACMLAGCSVAGGTKLVAPEHFGLVPAAPGLHVGQGLAAVQRYGEGDNVQRRARGEPGLRPLCAAAGHELPPWLRARGAEGLRTFIADVNAGVPFDAACARPGP